MRERNPTYRNIKKAIKKDVFPDPYFVAKYHFSPYMACEHACTYCDGRAEKYYVEGDYEKDIVVRKNLIEILKKELPKMREPGVISIGSGISDVYQPIEKEEKLMQKSAELLSQFDFGVTVLTKSSLVERDLELWKKVHFTLIMTLITTDESIRERFEPEASSLAERLQTLRKFKQAGMRVGVLAMPLLPYLSDSKADVQNLLHELKKIPVDFVLPGLLTLRPGRQKELFLTKLEEQYPHLRPKYEALYKKNLASGSPDFSYANNKFTEIRELIAAENLPTCLPVTSYRKQFALYDEIYLSLCGLRERYWNKKADLPRLNHAIRRYEDFILPFKRKFNRSRTMSYRMLEDIVWEKLKSGEMETILQNKKLANYLSAEYLEVFYRRRV